jgi:hypothetical protein
LALNIVFDSEISDTQTYQEKSKAVKACDIIIPGSQVSGGAFCYLQSGNFKNNMIFRASLNRN